MWLYILMMGGGEFGLIVSGLVCCLVVRMYWFVSELLFERIVHVVCSILF